MTRTVSTDRLGEELLRTQQHWPTWPQAETVGAELIVVSLPGQMGLFREKITAVGICIRSGSPATSKATTCSRCTIRRNSRVRARNARPTPADGRGVRSRGDKTPFEACARSRAVLTGLSGVRSYELKNRRVTWRRAYFESHSDPERDSNTRAGLARKSP